MVIYTVKNLWNRDGIKIIIREAELEFYMITQHDHAKLSGDIARNFREKFFVDEFYSEYVLFAIYEHDRAWIELDHNPIWNDKNESPFSFIHINQETISVHLRLLQLCDDISLYVCLNQPGATKENEHPWYRSGFNNTAFKASWINEQEISLLPSPFGKEFKAKLRLKRVSKEVINQSGIEEAYKKSNWFEQDFIFLNNSKKAETFT